ncbi:MAG: hypothetical protein K2X47_15510 [Bdellovibrionales bacterium]|nr:hypothetical protein [Bdellovibrionales bacterium]
MTKDPREDLFEESVSADFKDRVFASVRPELEKNKERAGVHGRRFFVWGALGSAAAAAVVAAVFVKGQKSFVLEDGLEVAAMDPDLLDMDEEFLADLEVLEGLEEIEGLEEEVDA